MRRPGMKVSASGSTYISTEDGALALKIGTGLRYSRQGCADNSPAYGVNEGKLTYDTHINFEKSSLPVKIKVGDTVKYTIDIYNETNLVGKTITIEDKLPIVPKSDSYVEVSGAKNWSRLGDTLTIETNELNGEDKVTVYVSIKLDEFVESDENDGALHNIARITKIGADNNTPSSNGSTSKQADGDWVKMNNISLEKFITQVTNSAGVTTYGPDEISRANANDINNTTKKVAPSIENKSLIKKDEPIDIKPGSTVTYKVRVRNLSERASATNIIVYDMLPYRENGGENAPLYDIDSIEVHGETSKKFYEDDILNEITIGEIAKNSYVDITIKVTFTEEIRKVEGNMINTAWTNDAALDIYRTEDHDYVYVRDVSLQKYIISTVDKNGKTTDLSDEGKENNRRDWIAKEDTLYTRNPSYRRSSETDNKKLPIEIAATDTVNYVVEVYNNTLNELKDLEVLDWCKNEKGAKATLKVNKIVTTSSTHDTPIKDITVVEEVNSPTYTTDGNQQVKIKMPNIPKDGYAVIYMSATLPNSTDIYNTTFTNHAELIDIDSGDTTFRYIDEDYVTVAQMSNVSLQKYVVEVNNQPVEDRSYKLTYESHDELNAPVNVSHASGYEKWYKANNPVPIKPGDVVKYKIEVYNNSNRDVTDGKITVRDVVKDKYGIEGIRGYLESILEITVNGTKVEDYEYKNGIITLPGISVPAYGTTPITLKVKFRDDTNSKDILINYAELELNGNETTYRTKDADFVELAKNVSMQKFITAVDDSADVKINEVAVNLETPEYNRKDTYAVNTSENKVWVNANMRDYIKKENPVEARQGNKVTYEIHLYSNMANDQYIENAKVTDILPLKDGNIDTISKVKAELRDTAGNVEKEIYKESKPKKQQIEFLTGEIDFTGSVKEKVIVVEITFSEGILDPTDTVLLENKAILEVRANDTIYRLEDSDYINLNGSDAEISMQKYITRIAPVGGDLVAVEPTREDRLDKDDTTKPYGVGHPNKTDADIPNKQVAAKGVGEGQRVEFTIKLKNNGGFDDTDGVQVIDDLEKLAPYMDSTPAIEVYNKTDNQPVAYDYNSGTKKITFPKDSTITIGKGKEKEFTVTIKIKDKISSLTTETVLPNGAKIVGKYISKKYRVEDFDYIKLLPSNVSLEKYVSGAGTTGDEEITDTRTSLVNREYAMYDASSTEKIAYERNADTTKVKKTNPVLVNSGEFVTFTVKVFNNTEAPTNLIKIKDTMTLNSASVTNVAWKITTYKNNIVTGSAVSGNGLSSLNNTGFIIPASDLATNILSYAKIEIKGKFTSTVETTVVNTAQIVGVTSSDYRIIDRDIIKIPVSSTDVSLQKYIYDANKDTIPTKISSGNITDRINKYAKTGNESQEANGWNIGQNFGYGVTGLGQHNGYRKVTGVTKSANGVGKTLSKATADAALREFKQNLYDSAAEGVAITDFTAIYRSEKSDETGWSDEFYAVTEAQYNLTAEKDLITGITLKYKVGTDRYYYRTRRLTWTGYTAWSGWIECSYSEYLGKVAAEAASFGTLTQTDHTEPVYYARRWETRGVTHHWYDCTWTEETGEPRERDTAVRYAGQTKASNGYKVDDKVTVLNGNRATFAIVVYNNDPNKAAYRVKVKDNHTVNGAKVVNETWYGATGTATDKEDEITLTERPSNIKYTPGSEDILIYEIPKGGFVILAVQMEFSSTNPTDLVRANGAYIDNVSGAHSTTKYRTADADYIQIGIPDISLQKYIVSTQRGLNGNTYIKDIAGAFYYNTNNGIIKVDPTLIDFNNMANGRKDFYAVHPDGKNPKDTHNVVSGYGNHENVNIHRTNGSVKSNEYQVLGVGNPLRRDYRKNLNPVALVENEDVTFTIRVYNNSSDINATNIVIKDELSSQVKGTITNIEYATASEGSDDSYSVKRTETYNIQQEWDNEDFSYKNNEYIVKSLPKGQAAIFNVTYNITITDKNLDTIHDLGTADLAVNGDLLWNRAYITKVGSVNYTDSSLRGQFRTSDADYFLMESRDVSLQKYINAINYSTANGGSGTFEQIKNYTRIGIASRMNKNPAVVGNDITIPKVSSDAREDKVRAQINKDTGGKVDTNVNISEKNLVASLFDWMFDAKVNKTANMKPDNSINKYVRSGDKVAYTVRIYNNKDLVAYNVRFSDYLQGVKYDKVTVSVGYCHNTQEQDWMQSGLQNVASDSNIEVTVDNTFEDEDIVTYNIKELGPKQVAIFNMIVDYDGIENKYDGSNGELVIGNYAWLIGTPTDTGMYTRRNVDADFISIPSEKYASVEKYIIEHGDRTYAKTGGGVGDSDKRVTPSYNLRNYVKADRPVEISKDGETVKYEIKVRTYGKNSPKPITLNDAFEGNGKITKIECMNYNTKTIGGENSNVFRTIWNSSGYQRYYTVGDTEYDKYAIYKISDFKVTEDKGFNITFSQVETDKSLMDLITDTEPNYSECKLRITINYDKLDIYDGSGNEKTYRNYVKLTTNGETDSEKLKHEDADYIKPQPLKYDVSLQKYIVERSETENDATGEYIYNRSGYIAKTSAGPDGDNKDVTSSAGAINISKAVKPVKILNNDTVTYKIGVYNNNEHSEDINEHHNVVVTDTFEKGTVESVKIGNSSSIGSASATVATNIAGLSETEKAAITGPTYTLEGNTITVDLGQLKKDETRAIFVTLKYTDTVEGDIYKNTAELHLSLNLKEHRTLDSDYVKAGVVLKPNVSLQKYITNVNDVNQDTHGNTIEARSGWIVENTPSEGENGDVTDAIKEVEKYKSGKTGAVRVKAGDKVTYRIEIHNNNTETVEHVIIADTFPSYGEVGSSDSVLRISKNIRETHIYEGNVEEMPDQSLSDSWEFLGTPSNGTQLKLTQKIFNLGGSSKRTGEFWEQNSYMTDLGTLRPNETIILEIDGVVEKDIELEKPEIFKNTARIISTVKDDNTDFRTLDSDYILVEPTVVDVSLEKYISATSSGTVTPDRSRFATFRTDGRFGSNKDVTKELTLIPTYKKNNAVKISRGDTVTYSIWLHNNLDAEVNGIKVIDKLPHDLDGLIVSGITCDHGSYGIEDGVLTITDITLAPKGTAGADKEIKVTMKFNRLEHGLWENAAEVDTGDLVNITEYRTADSDWVKPDDITGQGLSLQKYITLVDDKAEDIDGNPITDRSGLCGINPDYETDLDKSGKEYTDITYRYDNKNLANLDVTHNIAAKSPAKEAIKTTSGSRVTYLVYVYNNTEDKTFNNVVIEDQIPYYYYKDDPADTDMKRTTAATIASVRLHDVNGDLIGDLDGNGVPDGDLVVPGNELFKLMDEDRNIYSYTHNDLAPGQVIYLEITLDYCIEEELWLNAHDENPAPGQREPEVKDILPNRAAIIYTDPENDTEYRTVDFDYIYPIVDNTVDVSLEKVVWTVNSKDVDPKTIKGLDSSTGTGVNRMGGISSLDSNSLIKPGWQEESGLIGKQLVWRAPNIECDPDIGKAYVDIIENGVFDENTIKNKGLDPVHAEFGDTVTFRIYVYNNKGKDAHNVTVLDRLPYFNYDKTSADVFIPNKSEIKVYDSHENQITDFSVGDAVQLNSTYWNARTMNEAKGDLWKDAGDIASEVYKDAGLWGIEVKIDTLPGNEVYCIEVPIKLDAAHSSQWSNDNNGGIPTGTKADFDSNLERLSSHNISNEASVIYTEEENKTEYRIADYDYLYLKRYSVGVEKYISSGVVTDIVREGNPIYKPGYEKYKYNNVGVTAYDTDVTYTIIVTNTATAKVGGTDTTAGTTKNIDGAGIHRDHSIYDDFGNIYVDLKDTFDVLEKSGTTFDYNVVDNGGLSLPSSGNGDEVSTKTVGPIEPGRSVTFTFTIKAKEHNISLDVLENTIEVSQIRNKNGQKVHDDDGKYNNKDQDWFEMKDITLSGNVWNDVANNKTGEKYNGKNDIYEDKLDGIKVYLYRVGVAAPIATDTTHDGGKYEFALDYIKAPHQSGCNRWDNYYSYYIVFEYDGITYTSTYVNDDGNLGIRGKWIWDYKDNAYLDYSKAAEDNENGLPGLESRELFNGRYRTIPSESREITYVTKNEEGYIPESNYINADTMKASTDKIEFVESWDRENQVKNINLGLRGKEVLDLELYSDVEQIEITVNDVKGVYKYTNSATLKREDVADQAVNGLGKSVDEEMKNTIPEKSEGNYVDTVNHDLRSTDTTVSKANSSAVNKYGKTGIEVRVIYKITYSNMGRTNAQALKIKDYYDGHYYYAGLCDENGNIYQANTETRPGTYGGETYKEKEIPLPEIETAGVKTGIEQADERTIYLAFDLINAEYELSQADTLNNPDLFATYNMAEITEYRNYANAKYYSEYTRGLIDKDSAPDSVNKEQVRKTTTIGEATPTTETTEGEKTTLGYYFDKTNLTELKYEDDTFASPTIFFWIKDVHRILNGTVFEDKTKDPKTNSNVRVSTDGKYGSEDKVVKDATILLIEINDDVAKTSLDAADQTYSDKLWTFNNGNTRSYEEYNGKYYPIRYKMKSDSSGNYEFINYLPGDYILRYYYGDTEGTVLINEATGNDTSYNGEDYQSTKNQFSDGISTRTVTDDDGSVLGYWYLDNESVAYSVATDDVDRRITVSNNVGGHYANEGNDSTGDTWIPGFDDTTIESLNNIRKNQLQGGEDISKIITDTNMFANTQKMRINVEKTDAPRQSVIAPSYNSNYRIDNVNYGIAQAPKTNVELKKKIVGFKIKDSAGINSIVEGTYDDVGTKWILTDTSTGSTLEIPGLDPESTKYIDIQIEDDKLQGAKLEITYRIEAKMDQEKDFDKSLVTISGIAELFDYVDNDLSFNSELNKDDTSNAKWIVETSANRNAINPDHSGMTADTKAYSYNTTVKAVSGHNKLLDPLPTDGSVVSETIKLEKVLSSNNTSLARVLSTIEETYEYTNLVEVTKLNYVGNTSGISEDYKGHIFRDAIRRVDTAPDPYSFDANPMKTAGGAGILTDGSGNIVYHEYVMVGNWQHDTAISGTITIHPPTGDSGVPMSYYIIAVVTLGVVATGAFIVKRKMSKK